MSPAIGPPGVLRESPRPVFGAHGRIGWPGLIVGGILLVHLLMLGWNAANYSPTEDEPAHVAAAVFYWRFGRCDLYQVNPPLSRFFAGLPLLLLKPKTDWSSFDDTVGHRSEFAVGRDFIAANGDRSIGLVTAARWGCLPLSILGALTCYWWAASLRGASAGFVALLLWCISPEILGNACLISPDAMGAATGVAAGYTFWLWLVRGSWTDAALAGAAMGIAVLAKTTWIILFELWFLAGLVRVLWYSSPGHRLVFAAQATSIIVIALYVINCAYGFSGTMKALGDFTFVSDRLKGDAQLEAAVGNRFRDTWVGQIRVPLPQDLVVGMDLQQRDFDRSGKPSYLFGTFRNRGWWYYYLIGAFVKWPVGLLLIAVFVVGAVSFSVGRARCLNEWFTLVPAVAVLCVASSETGISHHYRYILPALPFLWIFLACGVAIARQLRPAVFAGCVACLAYAGASSLFTYPHSLSYFNECARGPLHGDAVLINSAIDWGQDLKYLKRWLGAHPDVENLKLAYWGHCDPVYMGLRYRLPPTSHDLAGLHESVPPGWYAVSVNFLRGFPWHAPNGAGGRDQLERNAFAYFQAFQPVASAGYSIRIYHIVPPTGAEGAGRLPQRGSSGK
jgi:hypothetical protein